MVCDAVVELVAYVLARMVGKRKMASTGKLGQSLVQTSFAKSIGAQGR